MTNKYHIQSALFCALLGTSLATHAAHIIYSPIIEYGETEIEVATETIDDEEHGSDGKSKYYLEFARGIAPRWMTEVIFEWEKTKSSNTRMTAIEWENIIQLTEQGELALDYGLLVEIEKSLEDKHPDEIAIGLLLEKEYGNWVGRFNLKIANEFGDNHDSEGSSMGAIQIAWRKYAALVPALEYYNSDKESTVGTMVSGKLKRDGKRFGYSAGVLWGIDNQTPDQTYRASLEYEFY